jgi:hypothetical protein
VHYTRYHDKSGTITAEWANASPVYETPEDQGWWISSPATELTGTVTETETLTAPNGRTYTTQKTVPATKAFTTVPHTYTSHGKTYTTTETVPDVDVTTQRRTETYTNHGRTYTTVVEEPTVTFQPWTSKYTNSRGHYTRYHDASGTITAEWVSAQPTYQTPEDQGWWISPPTYVSP